MSYIPSLTLPSQIFSTPALSILLPVAAGTSIGFLCRPNTTDETYLALKQPPYNPPPQVFGPVWTTLYALMGYGAYRAYSTGLSPLNTPNTIQATKAGATLYTIQLALNLAWMPLFFKFKRPVLATADIALLTGVTGYLAYTWAQVDEVAAWCLVPYLGWLGFATYLSAGVGHLNDWDLQGKEKPMSEKKGKTTHVAERDD